MKEKTRIEHAIMGPLVGGVSGLIISGLLAGKIRNVLGLSPETPNTYIFTGGVLLGILIGWVFRRYVGELWNIF